MEIFKRRSNVLQITLISLPLKMFMYHLHLGSDSKDHPTVWVSSLLHEPATEILWERCIFMNIHSLSWDRRHTQLCDIPQLDTAWYTNLCQLCNGGRVTSGFRHCNKCKLTCGVTVWNSLKSVADRFILGLQMTVQMDWKPLLWKVWNCYLQSTWSSSEWQFASVFIRFSC